MKPGQSRRSTRRQCPEEAVMEESNLKINNCNLIKILSFHQKLLNFFPKDRQTDTYPSIYRRVKFLYAFFDTFHFTTFALLTLFVKEQNTLVYLSSVTYANKIFFIVLTPLSMFLIFFRNWCWWQHTILSSEKGGFLYQSVYCSYWAHNSIALICKLQRLNNVAYKSV